MPRREEKSADELTFADVVESEGSQRESLVRDLVSRMTVSEKIDQMAGSASVGQIIAMPFAYGKSTYDSGENKRLGIPAIRFTDGPRGVCLDSSTCFPVGMARGSTWDVELQERVGSALGIEARALGANFFGGVCINLLRHPGWGRAQETFGEDPFHLGAMGVATLTGVQQHAMACVKHFACNSIEESRFFVDVHVDQRALREVYLPHFKRCARAGAACFMSAYNKVNGRYCGQNHHLLREILKQEWGYDGMVMSDFFWGVRDGVKAAEAGLDIEMPRKRHFGMKLKRAVRRGKVSMEVLDEAVTRVLRQKARFARVGRPAGYEREDVASPRHRELALEVARKGIVLLKNENGALPLASKQSRRIAVFGELADRANTGDRGSSIVRPPYVVTPLEGIRDKAAGSDVVYVNERKAVGAAAREADVALVIVGFDYRDEGEHVSRLSGNGGDRENLDLSGEDEALIKEVASAAETCVVVLEGGSAVTMETWKDEVDAILMAWCPGMEGGNALADILFGEVNPGGKLPITFPESMAQLPYFNKKARQIDYGYYHGYRHFDREGFEPAFPFGFGLSYSTFHYEQLRLSNREIGKGGKVEARFSITNRGKVRGDEVAQLYVSYKGSAVDRPPKELKGFARVSLEPNQTKDVAVEVHARELGYYNEDVFSWEIEEIEYVVQVGSSSRAEDLYLSDSFFICGP